MVVEKKVGRVDAVEEKPAWVLGAGAALILITVSLLMLAGGIALVVFGSSRTGVASVLYVIGGVILVTGSIIPLSMVSIIQPGNALLVTFFGNYVGTVRKVGLIATVPFSVRKKYSVKIRNFETNQLKVNDVDGNPVTVAAVVVWQVEDTARSEFSVEEYRTFMRTQAESAVRHVVSLHPYDSTDSHTTSLRGNAEDIAQQLAKEVSARTVVAGLVIHEVRLSSLAYAPEIAQAMLQRQQANAVLSARTVLVEGAVKMVEDALAQLEEKSIVSLDDERKAAMVSNLLVVLCSDSSTTPVVNTGSLYT